MKKSLAVSEFERLLEQVPFDRHNLDVVNADANIPLFSRLFDIIEHSDPTERYFIQQFIHGKSERLHKFVHWVLREKMEDDPCRYIRLQLIKLAIRNGNPDFHDDLLALAGWWDIIERQGLQAEPLFREASAYGAGWLFEQFFDPKRRAELMGSLPRQTEPFKNFEGPACDYLVVKKYFLPTPNRLSPGCHQVFGERPEEYARYFYSFLCLDLNEVNPEWSGYVYFMYWDFDNHAGIVLNDLSFKIENNKYYLHSAAKNQISDAEDMFANLRTLAVLHPHRDFDHVNYETPEELTAGNYVKLYQFSLPDNENFDSITDWKEAVEKALQLDYKRKLLYEYEPIQTEAGITERFVNVPGAYLGGKPKWVWEDMTPLNPDGKEMVFIGQIDPGNLSFDLPHGLIYMFYCPVHKLVTLIGQSCGVNY
jgi:hypothetical protein